MLTVAALIASLAFLALVIATIPVLLQLARTARAAEQTLATVEREVRPLTSQIQAVLQEHRNLAQQATKDLRQVEGVVVMAQDAVARLTSVAGLLGSFGSVGQALATVNGLRKGIDVFVRRLARGRGGRS